MKITTVAEIYVEQLAYDLPYNDALAMMKLLDEGQQDLDFTFEIATYLIRDIIVCDEPDGEYVKALKSIFEEKK